MQEQGTRFYRVKAVAERYDVSPATIYRAIQAGELDALKIGGTLRIPDYALSAFESAGYEAAYADVQAGTVTTPDVAGNRRAHRRIWGSARRETYCAGVQSTTFAMVRPD
jgi:excisionase family DNA binding protein